MSKDKERKLGKDQMLLEAARLGQLKQLENILNQLHTLKSKKKTNPLASLRKSVGPNNIRDPVTGFTCLHQAALNGHSECVKLMLDYGAKVNAVDYKGSSALHLAAWAGNVEVVKTLLDHSAALASSLSPSKWSSSSTTTTSAQQLQESSANLQHQQASLSASDSPNTKQLIDVDLCNNDDQTPISLAAQFGHSECVKLMLDYGASVHIRNNQLESALDLACLNGRLETVDLLLKHSSSLRRDLRRPYSTILHKQNEPRSEQQRQTSNTNCSPASTHGRRPSAGWASLLRGRRDSSTTSSPPNSSPLNRQTVAGLSMRQRPSLTDQADAARSISLERRRATLTSGASLEQQEQTFKQMSADGWFGDHQDGSILVQEVVQSGHQQQQKLLDHSPLHYATRRGHLTVVNLLLYTYEANLCQVTSRGSVLHEIALNNGKHSDIISSFFIYINNKQPEKRNEYLEQFLNLENSQQKNVFQILNEINNRSAQEVKRLIYEYTEQLQRQPLQPAFYTESGRLQQADTCSLKSNLEVQQQQSNTNYPLNTINTQELHQRQTNSSQQQFSDIQQINSFVTMKRVPKNGRLRSQQQTFDESTRKHLEQFNQQHQFAGCTQTIDRRRTNQSELQQRQNQFLIQSQQQQHLHQNFQQVAAGGQLHQSHFSSEAQPTLMTRSVSNLNRAAPVHHLDGQFASHINNENAKNDSLTSALMWRQWLSRGMPGSGSSSKQNTTTNTTTKSARSKSRDLGSLFSAKSTNGQPCVEKTMQDHLYDNNNWPTTNGTAATVASRDVGSQLVRSQTDCSHLMGRFFGDSGYFVDQHGKATMTHQHNQNDPQAQQQHLTQQALDRKMINRHYHVYEHEFYPPRMISAPDSKHPLGMMSHHSYQPFARPESGSSQLRASVRSNQSSSYQNQDLSSPNCNRNGEIKLRNNSRLSLNIDTQPRESEINLERKSQQKQDQHQNQQIDRFLGRHWKKTNNGVGPSQMPIGLIAEQKRQDLVELQQRLMTEQQHQQQQHPMHNSYSLESHLSEPYLFESTRQALMQGFDQMIGEELLNRNHMQIIEGNLHQHQRQTPNVAHSNSKQSILTGVMLDMDRYGEHLTVSGTRITLPEKPSSEGSQSKVSISSSSSTGAGSVSLGTQTSPKDLAPERAEPPPKPARPSLANKQTKVEQNTERVGVIYDLPTLPDQNQPKPSSRNQVAAPVAQQISASSKAPRTALTEAPKVAPPPPPPPTTASVMAHKAVKSGTSVGSMDRDREEANLSAPLTVMAPTSDQLISCAHSSSNSHGSSIDSEPSNTTAEFGLLKMASLTSNSSSNSSSSRPTCPRTTNSKQRSFHNNPNDADSGVCTSNSPASMSHDSEAASTGDKDLSGETDSRVVNKKSTKGQNNEGTSSAVVKHLVRRSTPTPSELLELSRVETGNGLISIQSPPSPKTAQLCIEEALMPLTKTANKPKMNSATTMTASDQAVDRWLTVKEKENENKESESDYENCQVLQQQLEVARNCDSIISSLFDSSGRPQEKSAQSSGSSESSSDDEDADYAASGSSNETSTSAGSNDSEATKSESSDELELNQNENENENENENHRKEITLKVVIDENETDRCGEEVFYINPLELKKISSQQKSQQSLADAHTLTDEELCATFDKSSGYIRFTLRKRRKQTEEDDERRLPKLAAHQVSGNSLPQKLRDMKRADALCAAAKKTKFYNSYERSELNLVQDATNILGARRHSELTSESISSIQGKQEQPNLSSSQSKLDTILAGEKLPDSNNNNNSAYLKFIDKHAACNLKQWFSTNLAGLIEYSSKFLQNGFDNVKFLNHPLLMNEQLLKLVGIQDESHRILILNRVNKELNEVSFEHLFDRFIKQEPGEKLTPSKLFAILELGHLLYSDIEDKFNFNTRESVQVFSEKYIANLPLGYRARLSSATDFLLNKSLIPTEQPLKEQVKQQIDKQASIESNPSEVDMDTSQASSVTTSSSSSKDSIKSIVQVKQQQQDTEETATVGGEVNQGEERPPEPSLADSYGAKKKIEAGQVLSSPKERAEREKKRQSERESIVDESPSAMEAGKSDTDTPVVSVISTGKGVRSGSLVSEAARRLEAAQKNSGPTLPVAAARRINTNLKAPQVSNSFLGKKNTFLVNQEQERSDKKPQQAVQRNTPAFVPVKSINWPPKSDSDKSVAETPSSDGCRSNKFSYQRYIEDINSRTSQEINKENCAKQDHQQQQQQLVKGRLKPALPAKPAKLAANRFIFENNKS